MKTNAFISIAVIVCLCCIEDVNSQGFLQRLRDRFQEIANNLPTFKFPFVDPPFTQTEEGVCPDVTVISEFDRESYLGKWYEIARYPVPYERNLRCVTAEYSNAPWLRRYIVVDNRGLREGSDEPSNDGSGAGGRAYSSDPTEPGKLTVTFTGIEPARDVVAGYFPGIGLEPMRVGNYWILDTDYKTYSLVHSCTQVGRYRVMSNWILWRTPSPEKAAIEEALGKFEENGVSRDPFHFTDQEDCNYS